MNETNQNKALEIAINLCKHFEGLFLKPYICPAGYPTIGYGTVYKPDGTKVTMEHPAITEQQAEDWLVSELRSNYMVGALKASPILINYPCALGAITDFCYNLGIARYRGSTLRRVINELDWNSSKTELMKWTKGGGRELPGLVRRRKKECEFIGID